MIVNLKEANHLEQLIIFEVTEEASMYYQWIFEKHNLESVESVREWVLQEVEFQTRALDVVHGLTNTKQGKLETRRFKRENPITFFGKSSTKADPGTERQYSRACRVCNKSHGTWAHPKFRQMEIQKRWECAKQHELCFVMDIWDSFVIERESVELTIIIVRKSTINYTRLPGGQNKGMVSEKKEKLPLVGNQDATTAKKIVHMRGDQNGT